MAFEKGKSGNPCGRPKGTGLKDLAEELRKQGAIDRAIKVMTDGLEQGRTKFEAAKWILEKVYGKAPQAVEMSGQLNLTWADIGKKIIEANE